MTIVEKRNGRREAPVSAETDERSLHRDQHLTGQGGRPALVAFLAARDGWVCRYCGRTLKATLGGPTTFDASGRIAHATIDHRVPSSRGGSDDVANLVLACASCNAQKRDRTEAEYLVWKASR